LRPSILDQLGVLAAVEWQAQDTERRTGIKCDVEVDPGKEDLDLDTERATAIFRIVQEALANVVRHSGATEVRIALHEDEGSVALKITDNGKGIDSDGASDLHKWGLIGMAERVASFKGRFGVMPAQPRGTTVSVWIPTARAPSQAARGRL
jgi:two-component system sensor histidine kinase UhpB